MFTISNFFRYLPLSSVIFHYLPLSSVKFIVADSFSLAHNVQIEPNLIRVIPEYLRITGGLSPDYGRDISELRAGYPRITGGLSKDYGRVI